MIARDLHVLARGRLDAGELPLEEPVRLLGAAGGGAECALCGASITPREIEYEVELPSAGGLTSWRFHIRCHNVWRDVCDELYAQRRTRQPA
ncbi:MAG: hypothetical protein ACRETT_15035 [Steroidobacteraceae bacterium]